MEGGQLGGDEWTRHGSFVNKPTRGWLHSDSVVTTAGVSYAVRVSDWQTLTDLWLKYLTTHLSFPVLTPFTFLETNCTIYFLCFVSSVKWDMWCWNANVLLGSFLDSTWVAWKCYSQCEHWTSTLELRSPGEMPHCSSRARHFSHFNPLVKWVKSHTHTQTDTQTHPSYFSLSTLLAFCPTYTLAGLFRSALLCVCVCVCVCVCACACACACARSSLRP